MAVADVGGSVDDSRVPAELLGGIDQIAVLAFRAAFWSGLEIAERHAPAVRSGWVEPPIGLDAAVDGQAKDLRFTNDTDGYLLIQAGVDREKAAIIWTLYGVPDGRVVSTTGPVVTDVRPALTSVEGIDDDRLPDGERHQAGWAREGATAEVQRTVNANGAVLHSDAFVSSYAPAADTIVAGTPQ
jgi:vancomycin resistance protein YoaR